MACFVQHRRTGEKFTALAPQQHDVVLDGIQYHVGDVPLIDDQNNVIRATAEQYYDDYEEVDCGPHTLYQWDED